MAHRKLGYLRDEPDGRDWELDRTKMLASYVPDEFSLEEYANVVFDQSNTNSCVANAAATALMIRELILLNLNGFGTVTAPSRLYMYYNSRKMHSRIVRDTGTYIRTCFRALKSLGAPNEHYWDFSSSMLRVNIRPSWNSYMMGNPRKDGSYYRIFETENERIGAVKLLISKYYPIVFGTDVSTNFLRANGPSTFDIPSSADEIAGSHAMVLIGYKTVNAGTLFRVQNSWGTGWGDGGRCWITENYLKWYLTSDLWSVDNWKNLQDRS